MYRDFDNFEERTFKVKKKQGNGQQVMSSLGAIHFKGSVYIYMYVYSICTHCTVYSISVITVWLITASSGAKRFLKANKICTKKYINFPQHLFTILLFLLASMQKIFVCFRVS